MSTHYYPWGMPDDAEQAPCGTYMGEISNVSGDWGKVTCRRCFRSKKRITTVVALEEADIVNQMGDMADFMANQTKEDE